MKIRIALLDQDIHYLNRLTVAFHTKYADKMEVHSFTTEKSMYDSLEKEKIDVAIISDLFEMDLSKIPSRCGTAYFVENKEIESLKNQKAICKFQKAELIYKQILNIYADKAVLLTGKKQENSGTKILLFTSFSGGTGCSSLAAGCAVRMAREHRKILYLNLEKMGDAELFFHGEGQLSLSDVIYALKSKKANVSLKIESAVKTSEEGVHYFAAPKTALDVMELNTEEVYLLIDELTGGDYQYIVLDVGFHFDEMEMMLWQRADEVIFVSDGSEIANSKFERGYNAIRIMQERDGKPALEKASLVYNRFSNKTGLKVSGLDIHELGGISRYEHAGTQEVMNQIAKIGLLDQLL